MTKNAFERFIQRCGTVKKATNILRTSYQNISSMHNGRTWVKHSYAKRVVDYLWKEMNWPLRVCFTHGEKKAEIFISTMYTIV